MRHFFKADFLRTSRLSVRGVGIGERMPPCRIERPHGTGDYLLMLFHQPAIVATTPAPAPLQPPETMMLWTPKKGQYYGNPSAPFSHSWIHCQGSRVSQILHETQLPVLKPFVTNQTPLFQQCLSDIHTELVSYTRPDLRIVGNLLEIALRALARSFLASREKNRIPENLLAVRQLIGTAPARTITLREMAAMAGLSVPHFCFRFKECFGLPAMECLIRHRMYHAAHLLADQNLNITEIAQKTGYDDPFHFSKTFKKHFGHSPRELRKRRQA